LKEELDQFAIIMNAWCIEKGGNSSSMSDLGIRAFNTLQTRSTSDSRYNIHAATMFHGKERFDNVSFINGAGDTCYGQVLLIFSILTEDMVLLRQYTTASISEALTVHSAFRRPKIQAMYTLFPFVMSGDKSVCVVIAASKIRRSEQIVWFDSSGCVWLENVSSARVHLFGIVNSLLYSPIFHTTE